MDQYRRRNEIKKEFNKIKDQLNILWETGDQDKIHC